MVGQACAAAEPRVLVCGKAQVICSHSALFWLVCAPFLLLQVCDGQQSNNIILLHHALERGPVSITVKCSSANSVPASDAHMHHYTPIYDYPCYIKGLDKASPYRCLAELLACIRQHFQCSDSSRASRICSHTQRALQPQSGTAQWCTQRQLHYIGFNVNRQNST